MKNVKLLVLVALAAMIYSCQNSLNELEESQDEKKNILIQMGFEEEEIQEFDTYFLVQGDMAIDKEDILPLESEDELNEQKEAPTSSPIFPESIREIAPEISPELLASNPTLPAGIRQRRSNTNIHDLINGNVVGNVRVQIHSSISGWSSLINQALTAWNNSGSKVNLTVVTSNPHITIYSDASSACPASHRNLASNVCGRGDFPTNGIPGDVISINTDSPFINTNAKRLRTITHEFGHNIGLAHTNTSFGVHITGTPTTDANSIMNSGECGTTKPISANDALAIKSLYPNCSNSMGEWYYSAQYGSWLYNGGQNSFYVYNHTTWITVNANQNLCGNHWFYTTSTVCGTSGWFYASTGGWIYSNTLGQWLNWNNC